MDKQQQQQQNKIKITQLFGIFYMSSYLLDNSF